ncbi:hypothetical protein [Methylobacterium sp. WL120]|uniref:hypothetical protein n=1 Tax=Methylobacterium sp. WL120 TaxID=2603887 RepID=UPI0011CA53BA|nr:hypothetical protein [Methylobacterium sp. WL120]TXM65855.1 hypothetical protein FV229_14375 [Methylobacterium sp. WL120]
MADRPIIFSAPMVRALLAGCKTQTRRLLKLPKWASTDPDHIKFGGSGAPEVICQGTGCLAALPLPYGVGDRLWVREGWRAARSLDRTPPRDICRDADVEHAATARSYAEIGLKGRLRPSIHMTRWASCLTLVVTEVRVERLNDISEADAVTEGMPDFGALCEALDPGKLNAVRETAAQTASRLRWPQRWFEGLWNEIHGDGAWAANPWVVAVTFTVHHANIDALDIAARAA